MSFLWWLISLVIAGAFIYYLVMSRPVKDKTVGVDKAATVRPGAVDEEFAKEYDEERKDDEDIQPDEPVNPTLAQLYSDEAIDASPLVNLDTAAAIASRGAGGITDEDEEYGADLNDVNDDSNGDEDDDDQADDDDDNPDDDTTTYSMTSNRLNNVAYMDSGDVKRESKNGTKKEKKRKRKH